MPVGYYHIWSEREGRLTSDPEAEFLVIMDRVEVILLEIE
jgi:hypothetical protein